MMRLYIYGAVVAAFLALGVYAAWQRGDAIAAEAEQARLEKNLAVVKAVNEANVATIDKITEQRLVNEALVLDLENSVYEATQLASKLNEDRAGVERSNEGVRDYLSNPIPDDLSRLYNNP